MKLRIISGELKGRYIIVPDSIGFRPTLERTRESVAEILKKRLRCGVKAADFCAGSGCFGFEMLSRGAVSVDFVERDKAAASQINKNAERIGVEERIKVTQSDVRKFADGKSSMYDLIFYDPPYADTELAGFAPKLLELLRDGGILVYERQRRPGEKKTALADGKPNMFDIRIFADTVIEFYTKEGNLTKNVCCALSGDL
ncbi:MAG: RsmD family RNA methyltransferase [Chitinispirillales bacterium]|jgi:16S rRNA (guanine966-N2)-methyltransferase|nr:RsmD family RNA methyltransferase [Chitinispirillales bacterium]